MRYSLKMAEREETDDIQSWRRERKVQVDRRGMRTAKREEGSCVLNQRWVSYYGDKNRLSRCLSSRTMAATMSTQIRDDRMAITVVCVAFRYVSTVYLSESFREQSLGRHPLSKVGNLE